MYGVAFLDDNSQIDTLYISYDEEKMKNIAEQGMREHMREVEGTDMPSGAGYWEVREAYQNFLLTSIAVPKPLPKVQFLEPDCDWL